MLTTAHYSPYTYDQNIVSLWRLHEPIKISQTCFSIQLHHKPHLLAQLYAITLPLSIQLYRINKLSFPGAGQGFFIRDHRLPSPSFSV